MIWLKRALLAILALLLWALLALTFVSKDRVCNYAINTPLAKAGVTFCLKEKEGSFAGCLMKGVTVSYGHSPVAKVEKVNISPLGVEALSITLQGLAKDLIPAKIASATYNPLSGKLAAEGDFGVLKGEVSLIKREVALQLLPSSLMKREYKQALKLFKFKNGKYTYAISF